MPGRGAGNTALGTAICRLIEQYEPEETRLFHDPVAQELVGTSIRWMIKLAVMRRLTMSRMDAITKGIYGAQICRTRYIDAVVHEAGPGGV